MNRRELFKGLVATLAVANMPLPLEQLVTSTDDQVLAYLRKLKLELMQKLINPPMVMAEDGTITKLDWLNDSYKLCITHINGIERELSA